MSNHYKIMEKEFIPLATVRKVFRKRNKKDLTYEQKMALENAEELTQISETAAQKIIDELRKMDLRKLKDEFIVKIADTAPNKKEELELILSPSKISFKDEELKQILDVVKKNAK